MKKPLLLGLVLCLAVSTTPAFAQVGGGGSSLGPVTGGALGTSAARPGTNSLGTAMAGPIGNGHKIKGPPLGTTGNAAAVERENARVDRMVRSICRGC